MLSNDTKATTFVINDTKLYVLVPVTLSTQDNTKLLQINQVLKEQLFGTSMNQNQQYKHQIHI